MFVIVAFSTGTHYGFFFQNSSILLDLQLDINGSNIFVTMIMYT